MITGVENRKKQIEKERKKILAQAREEKQEMLEEVLEKADGILDEIKEIQKMENSHDIGKTGTKIVSDLTELSFGIVGVLHLLDLLDLV